MRYLWMTVAVTVAILVVGSGMLAQQAAPAAPPTAATPHKALVDRYCTGCHNQRAKVGGLALDTLNLASVGPDAEIWEKAIKKLRGGQMPPPGMPQPDRAAVASMITYLEDSLDKAATVPTSGLAAA